MLGILAIIVFILDLIVAFEVLNSCRSVCNKVLWILIILFLPILGMLLYFCCADRHKHFHTYQRIDEIEVLPTAIARHLK